MHGSCSTSNHVQLHGSEGSWLDYEDFYPEPNLEVQAFSPDGQRYVAAYGTSELYITERQEKIYER
jgi:hypothetical protein